MGSILSVNDANADADGDGLSNLAEYQNATYPNDSDTDNDGIPDGWEILYGLNPRSNDANQDPDGDGFTNLTEFQMGTDPNVANQYSVSIADASAAEGTRSAFTITLDAARAMPVNVTATVADGTATLADSDYTNASGLITIPAGAAGQTYAFTVPTTADAKVEPNETFTVTLTCTDPNATMPAGSATGTITDDGDTFGISIADASASEGDGITFTVTLVGNTQVDLQVDYSFTNGSAVGGTDFNNAAGFVTFPAGSVNGATQSFTVSTTEDAVVEANEAFTVTVTSAHVLLTAPPRTPPAPSSTTTSRWIPTATGFWTLLIIAQLLTTPTKLIPMQTG